MYIQTNTLPETIVAVLASLGYSRKDIQVEAHDTISPACGGGEGIRGFFAIINLATGQTEVMQGSWGGANFFNKTNQVDLDTTPYPIPPNFAVIKGHEGGGKPVYAYITIRPDMMVPWLPTATNKLSPRLQWILSTLCMYTSAGRKSEFNQYNRIAPTESEYLQLIDLGFIKRTKAGAISVTTEGKNARVGNWAEYANP
jgi:hypothetical protein